MLPEINSYIENLRALRAKVLETLDGLDADALNWTPLPKETNSLYVLATHSIGSEHGWIAETLAQYPKTRDRDSEFVARGESVETLREKYARIAQETEEILAPLSENDLATIRQGSRPMTERDIILHVLQHCSEHLGQMRLTRQLWESLKSKVKG